MTGKLIEFPRKLEWKSVETWIGTVAGTLLLAKVEEVLGQAHVQWSTYNGPIIVNSGVASTMEEGKKAAKEALETGVLVMRVLPASKQEKRPT